MVGVCQCRLDAVDAAQKSLAIVRLQQIVERLHIECLNGVLGVGGGEYDVRGLRAANGLEHIEAAVRAQLDVQIDQVRFASRDFGNRGLHGIRLRNHLEFRQRRQDTQQLGARGRFVVDDDNRVGKASGKLRESMVGSGVTASRMEIWTAGKSNK